MFTAFFLLSISIGVLTAFALKTKGPAQAELKITLKFMSANFKALMKNIQTLLLILLKDLVKPSSEDAPITIKAKADQPSFEVSNEIESINNEMETPLEDQDTGLSDFSPELIQFIEEEENKAA